MSVETDQPDEAGTLCSPCRGTGKVISNLGGEPREVICPWCEGSGEVKPEHDAQAQAPAGPPSSAGGASDAPEAAQ